MTISQRATDTRSRMKQASPGDLVFASNLHAGHRTLLNSDGQASQSDTIVVDTATNSHVYAWTIDGIALTYTADGSATKAEIADGIAAATNNDPLVRGRVDAVSDGVDTVAFTGLLAGESFAITAVDAKLTHAAVVTAAAASEVEAGRLIISTTYTDEGEESGVLAAASAFTAQVDTLTPSGYVAGAELFVKIVIDGWFSYMATEVSATNLATTLTALVATLNALLPASSVLAASTGTAITLTAELAGIDFDAEIGSGGGGSSDVTWITASTKARSTSALLAAAGVSRRTTDQYVNASGDPVFQANDPMLAMEIGEVWIEKASGEAPTNGDRCYVEMNAAGENGRIYTARTATRIALPLKAARYTRDARSNSGDLIAGIRCDFSN